MSSLRSLGVLALLACGNAPPPKPNPPAPKPAAPKPDAPAPAVTVAPKRTRIAITPDMPPALRDYIESSDRACERGVQVACEYNVKSYFAGADQACADAKPNECHDLAEMYRKGDSIDPNPARAIELHEKGCAQGDVRSCFEAGMMNKKGGGIPVNVTRALQLFETGCEAKDEKFPSPQRAEFIANACYNAAILSFNGKDVAKDLHKSAELSKRACDLGGGVATHKDGRARVFAMGCAQFAEQLSLGQGVPKDEKRAAVLLQAACDADEGDACQALARLYHLGGGVAKDEARARELMTRACGLGISQACGYPG